MPALPLELLERLADTTPAAPDTDRKRVLVIVNPYATTMSDRLRTLVLYALRGRYDVEAVDTQGRGHATTLCREAAHEGYDAIVAFGGDGTINEAANGLAGSDTPLTCLPAGATNVLCRMLGIPGDIVDATAHLLRMVDRWSPRRIDLANVNGRHFTFSSGLGLDASVVKRVDAQPARKTALRQWYFAYSALRSFATEYVANPPRVEVRAGEQTLRGVTLLVQNGDPLTYFRDRPLHLAQHSTLESGRLAGAVLHRASPLDVPGVALRLFTGAPVTGHKRVSGFFDVAEVRARSLDERPIPLEVDGDYLGDVDEAIFGVTPRGLAVVA